MLITFLIILVCYISMFISLLITGGLIKFYKIDIDNVKYSYFILFTFILYALISYGTLYIMFLRG